MSSFFLIRGDDPAGEERIEVTSEMLVGRSDECDLRVQEGHPSRRHARLTMDGEELWLEDLGSANGTTVNGRPVAARVRLQHGDRVAFDLSRFVVVAPGGTPAGEADATVVRRLDADPQATVVRPAPAPPSAQSASPSPAVAPASPPSGVPRSWADPEYQPEGTRVLTPEELKAMAVGEAGPVPGGPMASGPHLRVRNGHSAGSVLVLASGSEWTIGSDAGRDLRLDDPGISGFHAKITQESGRWRVIDQMSANGTYVNGEKATVSYLKHGDHIRAAQVELELHLPDARGSERTATAGGTRRRPWLMAGIVAVVTLIVLAAATRLW